MKILIVLFSIQKDAQKYETILIEEGAIQKRCENALLTGLPSEKLSKVN